MKQNFFVKLIKFNLTSILAVVLQFASVFIFVHLLGENLNILGFQLKQEYSFFSRH